MLTLIPSPINLFLLRHRPNFGRPTMIVRTFLSVALFVFAFACCSSPSAANQLLLPEKTLAQKEGVQEESQATQDRNAWREMFLKKDFAGLEKVADKLVRDKPKYDGGLPHLSNFCSIAF